MTSSRLHILFFTLICFAVVHAYAEPSADATITGAAEPALVQLKLDSSKMISDRWQGFGFSGDIFPLNPKLTDLDRKLIRERIKEMRPQLVRVYFTLANWELEYGKRTPDGDSMRQLRETLSIYKEAGAEIQLHEWGYNLPPWCRPKERAPHPEDRRKFTDSFVSAVKYLRNDCGFSNIRYVTIYNEPNWGGIPWEDYVAVYHALDASLKAAGMRNDVMIMGPDEANENKWFPKATAELDDVIDCYEVHNYTSNTGSEFGSYVKTRTTVLPQSKNKKAVPPRKRLVISEFGMSDGMSTWESPHIDEYSYGIFTADSAIMAVNAGVSGMLAWCVMDIPDFGQPLKWGLWKSKEEKWEPRSWFYAWSLVTRYTEHGSTVHPLECGFNGIGSTAFRAPDNGLWTLMIVNRQSRERPYRISGLPAGSMWRSFSYCRKAIPTQDRKMIPESKPVKANHKGELSGVLSPDSFLLLYQKK